MSQEVKIMLGIGLFCIALAAGAVIFFGNSSSQPAKSIIADSKLLVRDDSQRIAAPSAKVTIVEFGDYQCPACGVAHPIVKAMLKEYEGRVNFVFRNFPLSQHKNAQIAAEAAEAAGEQGKFWQMYDKLYENQENWSENSNPLDIFVGLSNELELDTDQFKEVVNSNKYSAKIQQDLADGSSLGVNSTPTFFINGKKFPGVLSFNDFKNQIDPLL